MARIEPLPIEDLPDDVRPVLEFAQSTMGFTPNDVLTMARWPEMLQAMLPVVGVMFSPGRVDMELKRLVALVTSISGGCQYCVAHNACGLFDEQIEPDKRAAVWEFQSSVLFSAAERAALTFAQAAGHAPNQLTDAQYADLQQHFDDQQIMELAAVTCLFAFLNRWNSTFKTPLEDAPRARAEELLGAHGWNIGDHE